jgi:hypothetical protein
MAMRRTQIVTIKTRVAIVTPYSPKMCEMEDELRCILSTSGIRSEL